MRLRPVWARRSARGRQVEPLAHAALDDTGEEFEQIHRLVGVELFRLEPAKRKKAWR